jgi:hypothetical protein
MNSGASCFPTSGEGADSSNASFPALAFNYNINPHLRSFYNTQQPVSYTSLQVVLDSDCKSP